MSYAIWTIPTTKGREDFGWVNKRMKEPAFDSLDEAQHEAYLEDCDEPAPDKGQYRKVIVLPELGIWQGAGPGLIEVLGYNDNDSGIPHVRCCAQGGGFEFTVELRMFLKAFRPAALKWTKVRVTGDWCDPDESFEAWWNGMRWNGWVMPYFTSEEAGRMASRSSGLNLHHRVVNGVPTWMASQSDEEDSDHFPLTWLDLGSGTQTPMYPVGAGCWCWELADVTETA